MLWLLWTVLETIARGQRVALTGPMMSAHPFCLYNLLLLYGPSLVLHGCCSCFLEMISGQSHLLEVLDSLCVATFLAETKGLRCENFHSMLTIPLWMHVSRLLIGGFCKIALPFQAERWSPPVLRVLLQFSILGTCSPHEELDCAFWLLGCDDNEGVLGILTGLKPFVSLGAKIALIVMSGYSTTFWRSSDTFYFYPMEG